MVCSSSRLCVPRHFSYTYKSLVLLLVFVLHSECFQWQESVYPRTVYANRSQEALFRWKYTLGSADGNNVKIRCGYIPPRKTLKELVVIISKVGHRSRVTRQRNLPGRYGQVQAYQEELGHGKVDPSVVGFKIMKGYLYQPTEYYCLGISETGKDLDLSYSLVKTLVVLDPPVLIDCLESLLPVKAGERLRFSCKVSGNPAPRLQCQILDMYGTILERYPAQASINNISDATLVIPRVAEEIMCIAFGGDHTGTVNKTEWLTVHHTPSAPEYIEFVAAVNTSSLRVLWPVIANNETGGEIWGYNIEYYKSTDLEVSRKTINLPLDRLSPPIEEIYSYEFYGLYPDDEYTVSVWGYNKWGNGLPRKKFVTPGHIEPVQAGASSASVGAIIGGIIAGIVFIVIFVVLAVWCSTRSKRHEKLPTSFVEDAVDYPQGVGGQSLYANVDKNKNKTSRNGSTTEYPDVVTGTNDMKPFVSSNSYEPSNKSFV